MMTAARCRRLSPRHAGHATVRGERASRERARPGASRAFASSERSAARSCSARRCAGRARRGCDAPLAPGGKRMAAGLRALGLGHRRRAARAPAERQPRGAHDRGAARGRAGDGGGARSARSAHARCAGAACARWWRRPCSTPPAAMRATFFNQPWLVERYPPGTRLLLHGKADGRGGFRVSHHASSAARSRLPGAAAEARGPRARRSRTTRRRRASPRRRSSRSCTARATRSATSPRRSPRRRACASGCPTGRARSRRCTSRAIAGDLETRAPRGWPSRSCCSTQLAVPAPPRRRAGRAPARPRSPSQPSLERALAGRAGCRSR